MVAPSVALTHRSAFLFIVSKEDELSDKGGVQPSGADAIVTLFSPGSLATQATHISTVGGRGLVSEVKCSASAFIRAIFKDYISELSECSFHLVFVRTRECQRPNRVFFLLS